MSYTACNFIIKPVEPFRDLLVAMLEDLPFESFEENENGLTAYIQSVDFKESELQDLLNKEYFESALISYSVEEIEKQNWNKTWEDSFSPILVKDKFVIRGPFHETVPSLLNLVIVPKMSFGTGHHETTRLICETLFDSDLKDISVLDVGTGTGILAIMAINKGAKFVLGTDIDQWSVENSIENANLNSVHPEKYKFVMGDIEVVNNQTFELVLANINKLVLMKHLPTYERLTKQSGTLLLSGFFTTDADDLIVKAEEFGFKFDYKKHENNWCMLAFTKI